MASGRESAGAEKHASMGHPILLQLITTPELGSRAGGCLLQVTDEGNAFIYPISEDFLNLKDGRSLLATPDTVGERKASKEKGTSGFRLSS